MLRTTLSYLVFPALLLGVVGGLWRLRQAGADLILATSVLWVLLLSVLVVLERVLPHEARWHTPDGQLGHDFAHTFVGSAVGSRLGALVVELTAASTAVVIDGAALWPAKLPLVAQIALAYLALDGLRYAQHRIQHASPALWETHKLHHDPSRLIAIKAGRSHFFDRALQAVCVLPLVLIGASAEVLFWAIAVNSLIGLIGHANIDCRLGPLAFLFVGPAEHRVHHALVGTGETANFGASLTCWDRLFGTFRAEEVRAVGLEEPTPHRFLAQLAAPVEEWTSGQRRLRGGPSA